MEKKAEFAKWLGWVIGEKPYSARTLDLLNELASDNPDEWEAFQNNPKDPMLTWRWRTWYKPWRVHRCAAINREVALDLAYSSYRGIIPWTLKIENK